MSNLIVVPTKFELKGIINSFEEVESRTPHKIAIVDNTKLIFLPLRKKRKKLLSALFKKYDIENSFILGTAGAISKEDISQGETFYIKTVFKKGNPPRELPTLGEVGDVKEANIYTSRVPIILEMQKKMIRKKFPVKLVDMESYKLVNLFKSIDESPHIFRIVLDFCNSATFRNWKKKAKPLMKKLFTRWRELFL